MAANQEWVPEYARPYLDDMTVTQIWNELLLDAKMHHATDLTRFKFAIAIMSRKRKKHADTVFIELENAAKEINGYGLPSQPPTGLGPVGH